MFDDKLIESLVKLNDSLIERENHKVDKEKLRNKLSTIGRFVKIERFNEEELMNFSKGKGIVGIDGSYVTVGNSYPNMLFIAQALAKCTNAKDDGVKESNIFTDIIKKPEDSSSEIMLSKYSKEVTKMEVRVAKEGLLKYEPCITLFDGGFWRLFKEANDEWTLFRKTTLDKGVLAVGVIEDIGSYDLCNIDSLDIDFFASDSDLLFNVLNIGEAFVMNKAYREDFLKAFARFSDDPMPIACDFIPEQKESIQDILRLVYTLTSKHDRGIPLWIDIVDKEVKLTKEMANSLIDAYINPVVKEKIFTGKRTKR